jgi:hypothetical protein
MKCLSIRPPWAWMIIHLQSKRWKDVENRTWTTNYRGPLLIHASSTLTREEYDDACFRAISDGWARRSQLPQFTDIDAIRGQLIGAVHLSNVAPPAIPFHRGTAANALAGSCRTASHSRPAPFVAD